MRSGGDVLIIGGGVIGLTTAYLLAKEGLRILVCDQAQTGMEASWAGAGILPPSDPAHAKLPVDRLRALSGRLFGPLSAELKERTGIDNGYLRCGGLEFAEPNHPHQPDEWYGAGVPTERLSADQARKLEPALAADLGTAIHVPGMAQLRNPWHLRALRAAVLGTGKVTIREQTEVQELMLEKNRVKAIRMKDEELTGDSFLLAAGAWSGRLLEPIGIRLPVEPVRGQIALVNPSRLLFRRILAWGPRYLVPRSDGRVLIGSTEEYVGFDKATTAGAIGDLLKLAVRLVPALADAPMEKSWAGLRPGSPDGLPFIGPVPGIDNLLVAAGHYRAGIQLSPGTALLLTERLTGRPLSLPIEAFRVDRDFTSSFSARAASSGPGER